MNRVLAAYALLEAATGIVALVAPNVLVRLLFGAELVGAGVVVTRFTGVALLGLGIACWPSTASSLDSRAYAGMSTYGGLAALWLVYIALAGPYTGKLLWPAALTHVILTVLLALEWKSKGRR